MHQLLMFDGLGSDFGAKRSVMEWKGRVGNDDYLLPSWVEDPESDCCRWERVRCNSTTGRVIELSLNGFEGEYLAWNITLFLPFKELRSLDLSDNNIDGWIENQVDLITLERLEKLDLSYNNFFVGSIPPFIGKLSSLKALYLSGIGLFGYLPNSDLHRNLFNGSISPYLISSPKSLQFIDFRDNHFEGSFLFSSIFNHSKFEVVIVGSREKELQIDTEIRGWNPQFQLEALVLSHCNLKSATFLLNQHRLKVVDLSHNKLNGKFPSLLLENSSDLKFLNLKNNSISGEFHLPQHPMSGMIDIDVSNYHIGGRLPKDLEMVLSNLKHLNLSKNNFEGDLPSSIGRMRKLVMLNLSLNNFSGKVPKELGKNCTDLRILMLSGNKFQEINEDYGTYHERKFLIMTTQIGSALLPLVEVEIDLVTKSNLLSYKHDILNYMSGLDLSCNNLTGEIPEILGKLSSIRALNFSHNHLTGSIPASFSNLSKVESLYLSYNSLSGKIPVELVNLNFLEVFTVAHNNLSGRIPDKGQFATSGSSSYEGNPFLSGFPSEKNHTLVVETPSDNESTERWYEIDHTFFFASFTATYFVFLLGFGALLYINPYWRRRWFYFIENFLYSTYYFVVDTLHKLSTIVNN
ncbi:hypothetical protein CRYUN_Cryun38cG0028700 [Craigia yunnanensis]